jgi:hypothetical protein
MNRQMRYLAGAAMLILAAQLPVYPSVTINPPTYVCYKLPAPVTIDGIISDEEWGAVPPVGDFRDIYDDGPAPWLRTDARIAHDDAGIYFAARMEEPHLWATFTEHDAPLYQENAFELFIDPSNTTHNYLEYEVNVLGTEWDLFLSKPYRDAPMLVLSNWEFLGMKSAVFADGTPNDPSDRDRSWSVEIFIPWRAIYQVAEVSKRKPAEGDQMRINMQRVEWALDAVDGKYVKSVAQGDSRPKPNFWLWASQGQTGTSHAPEFWGYVQFTETPAGTTTVPFVMSPDEEVRTKLRNLYYRQKEIFSERKQYAAALAELRPEEIFGTTKAGKLKLYNTPTFYEITYEEGGRLWHLSSDGMIGLKAGDKD